MDNAREEAVGVLLCELEDAWNRGDIHAYAAVFASDAAYVSRAGALWEGRAEIEGHHTSAFAGPLRNTELRLAARRVRFLAPTLAVANVDVELRNRQDPTQLARAISTLTLAGAAGDWKIAAAHTSEVA